MCYYCNKALPGAYRKEYTQKIIENAVCSPFCKIRNQIITIDTMGCWVFGRPAFTWAGRSYSVKKYMYGYIFQTDREDPLIIMVCNRTNCANPDHMESFGRQRLSVK